LARGLSTYTLRYALTRTKRCTSCLSNGVDRPLTYRYLEEYLNKKGVEYQKAHGIDMAMFSIPRSKADSDHGAYVGSAKDHRCLFTLAETKILQKATHETFKISKCYRALMPFAIRVYWYHVCVYLIAKL
jgi:hypothetical protein